VAVLAELELLSGGHTMRRRVMITCAIAAFGLCFGLILFTRPPAPSGKFPPEMTDAEKRQIISAANSDALKRTFTAIRDGQIQEAWHWLLKSRKQTVRSIGQQPDGTIWVHFGVDDPRATDGYAIWARYIMKREKDQWVIKTLF
jgi:hypothetical protein